MSRYLFTFLLCMFSLSAFAQTIAVETRGDRHEVYMCIDNEIKIVVEGHKSNSLIVTANNGEINSYGNNTGKYFLRPNKPGYATIYVKEKNQSGKMKIIDSATCKVKRFPLGEEHLNGKRNGSQIPKNTLIQILGIGAGVPNWDDVFPYRIRGYSVFIFSNGKEIFNHEVVSAGNSYRQGIKIDSVTHDFFYSLQDNDSLTITNFQVEDCDGTMRYFDPVNYTIVDAEKAHKKGAVEKEVDPIDGKTYIKKY